MAVLGHIKKYTTPTLFSHSWAYKKAYKPNFIWPFLGILNSTQPQLYLAVLGHIKKYTNPTLFGRSRAYKKVHKPTLFGCSRLNNLFMYVTTATKLLSTPTLSVLRMLAGKSYELQQTCSWSQLLHPLAISSIFQTRPHPTPTPIK